jgi:hypothetical protein
MCSCGKAMCDEHNHSTPETEKELLQKLIEIEESKIPEGIQEAETQIVNPPGIIWDVGDRPTFQTQLRGPWISFALTNDGPGVVTMIVNNTVYKDTIKSGETRDVNMVQKGKIKRLELAVTATATVRISAIR